MFPVRPERSEALPATVPLPTSVTPGVTANELVTLKMKTASTRKAEYFLTVDIIENLPF
jgi:hypothetical protein